MKEKTRRFGFLGWANQSRIMKLLLVVTLLAASSAIRSLPALGGSLLLALVRVGVILALSLSFLAIIWLGLLVQKWAVSRFGYTSGDLISLAFVCLMLAIWILVGWPAAQEVFLPPGL